MTIAILPVVMTCSGAAAMLNLWLAARVIRVRASESVSIGDGGNDLVARRMRAQLNFAEYTPIVLILIALIELAQGTGLWLWLAGALYILGRIAHIFGMDGWMPGRMAGTMITLTLSLVLALWAILIVVLA